MVIIYYRAGREFTTQVCGDRGNVDFTLDFMLDFTLDFNESVWIVPGTITE